MFHSGFSVVRPFAGVLMLSVLSATAVPAQAFEGSITMSVSTGEDGGWFFSRGLVYPHTINDGSPNTFYFGMNMEHSSGCLKIPVTDGPGGCAHSVLYVTRTAYLTGDVRLQLVFHDGYKPRLGDTYDVLVAEEVVGVYDHMQFPAMPPGLALRCESLAGRVRVTVVPAEMPGQKDDREARDLK